MATVEVGSLLAVVNVTRANQVHVMFRARLLEPKFAPGPESLEVGLYEEAEVPWSDLAFAERRICVAAILRGPQRRARGTSFHRTEKRRSRT